MSNQTETAVAESEDVDAQIAALEAELNEDGADEIVETAEAESDPIDTVDADDAALEEVVAEANMEEAKTEAYEQQEAGEDDMSTDPVEKKTDGQKKAPRVTMTGAKKSEVITQKLGNNMGSVLILVKDQEPNTDEVLEVVDKMAKKVGEKAVNLFDMLNKGDAKSLSKYTEHAFRFLVANGSITAKELIDLYQSGDTGKPYSKGTANSQGHQMFQLFPQLKIGVMDGKTMKLNEDSAIVEQLKSLLGL